MRRGVVKSAVAATLILYAGCAPEASAEVEPEAVGLQAAALHNSFKGCDKSDNDWEIYGNSILGQRCVKDHKLPDASEAGDLALVWDNPVSVGTTSTPAISKGRVYYGDNSAKFYCADADTGAIIWQTSLFTPGTVSGFDPIRGSATLTNKHVYVASGHKLFKLDRKTGAVVWSHLMDQHFAVLIDSSPTVVDDMVFIGVAGFELAIDVPQRSFRGSVVALDDHDGSEIWRTYTTNDDAGSGAGVSVWSSVVIDKHRRLAFVGTGNTYEAPAAPLADSLLALDMDTGEIVWSHQFVAGDIFVQAPTIGPGSDSDVGATPNLFEIDHQDVVGVGSKSGVYKIFDRDTGEVLTQFQLTTAVQIALSDPNIPDAYATAYIGGIMGSAAVADGIIYLNSNIWFTYSFAFNGTHNPADTSVTYAVDAATGDILWARALPAPHFGGLTKVNDVIYHTTIDGHLYGLNAKTGAIVFNETLPGSAGGGVSAAKGKLYVGYGFTFRSSAVPTAGVRAYALD